MLGAYMQIHRINTLYQREDKDDLFCYKIPLTPKIERVEVGLTFLNYFYART